MVLPFGYVVNFLSFFSKDCFLSWNWKFSCPKFSIFFFSYAELHFKDFHGKSFFFYSDCSGKICSTTQEHIIPIKIRNQTENICRIMSGEWMVWSPKKKEKKNAKLIDSISFDRISLVYTFPFSNYTATRTRWV